MTFALAAWWAQGQSYQAICVADAQLNYNTLCADWQNMNVGATTSLIIAEWTWAGIGCGQGSVRGVYQFDLNVPALPNELYDNRATLLLYYPDGNSFQHQFFATPPGNDFQIQRITEPWLENTITWSNQPPFTGGNSAVVPSTISPSTQDFQIDLSPMVFDWLCRGIPNYGINLKQVNEGSILRNINLTTREWPNPADRPKLQLEYARIEALGPDTICLGQTIELNTSLINAAVPANYTFNWLYNNTTFDGDQLSITPTAPGLHTFTLQASNNTCQTATDVHTVWVSPPATTTPVLHD